MREINRVNSITISLIILLAAGFWYISFATGLVNFWFSMGTAAFCLSMLALVLGGLPFKISEIKTRNITIGILSAFILYLIFWVGNFISQHIFWFAGAQVGSVYEIRTQAEVVTISLVLLFVTSPGEEIFWRGFLQRWAMAKLGPYGGWIFSSLIYAGVHISSGNFMLIMAALVAGLFWGYIYMKENSLVPVIISHALWTLGIFILFPVM